MTARFLLLCALSGIAACSHRSTQQSAIATAAPDSLLGIVAITGTSFEQRLVLRSGSLTTSLTALTADSAALSGVAGVEVLVRGRAEGNAFRVASFTVMRVEGVLVADGVLRRDGDRLVLETSTSRITLGNPPAAFRTMVGARVWVGGPLDTGPNVYGVIVPPP